MELERDDWEIIDSRQDIADYYHIGLEALTRTRPKPRKGKIGFIMSEIANAHDVTMSAVQAARKIAEVISPRELAELIELSGRVGFELGKEHVTLLSTVPDDKERKKWRNAMLEYHWSVEDFRDELNDAYGFRGKGGGSDFEMPKSTKEARWSVRRFNRRFKGLAAVFSGTAPNKPTLKPFRPFVLDKKTNKLLIGISMGLDELEAAIAKLELEPDPVPLAAAG